MAAGCRGDWERAQQHFEDALRASRELPMRHEEPEACRFYAQMLLQRGSPGDRAAARELLERAIGGYEAFQMSGHAALARSIEV